MPDGLYLADVGYPAEFELPQANLRSEAWSEVWGT
jgi:tRNA pseudouridine38-40 synthase